MASRYERPPALHGRAVQGRHTGLGKPKKALICPPSAVVALIHPDAMPAFLTTLEETDTRLSAPAESAFQLRRPLPDEALTVLARGQRKDGPDEPLA